MRIVVDTEACTGHALCFAMAPEVFVLDDLGYNVTPTLDVPPELEEQARRGMLACPEMAISIED